jgi:hypothetical protein
MQGDPTCDKPAKSALIGNYKVDYTSLGIPNAETLKSTTIKLSANGSFSVYSNEPETSGTFLPSGSGIWRLHPDRGRIDFGSRENWGIRFESTCGTRFVANCLGDTSPYRLLFIDSSCHGMFCNHLIMKKVEQGVHGNTH